MIITYKRDRFENFDGNFSALTCILSDKRLSLNHETMEDLVMVFGNNHLPNQSERGKTFKQIHQLYILKKKARTVR